jgi:hypothetical protein
MSEKIPANEDAIIKRALQAMREKGPTVPATEVRKFLAKVGEEIERTGKLSEESVDALLQQLF